MKSRLLAIVSILVFIMNLPAGSLAAESEGGDQILDGIGETAMIARYIFNGNVEDRSRNAYHATLHGTGATFVEDSQFGQVLSLPGDANGGYVQVPGQALVGIDTITVTGWIYLKDKTGGPRFFDFGKGGNADFYCSNLGIQGGSIHLLAPSPFIPMNEWVHIAVVLDTTGKTVVGYQNGVRFLQSKDVKFALESVINQDNAASNLLYIGRSIEGTNNLNAKLHDVRLYSVALTDEQVSTIRNNALKIKTTPAGGTSTAETKIISPTPSSDSSQLIAVPDITAETTVGTLPYLPYYIRGKYSGNASGPLVRVIWPAPADTNDVREPGEYKVTGSVPGTDFKPSATVTIKAAPATAEKGPVRTVEAFELGEVVLNKDDKGQDTQFIKNRDKFINGLVMTDANSFLYNFRATFGQRQPEGVRALRGWDSQTTRLRGHASGHYLSALAQAYASTGYDKNLQDKFRQKMDYMIDTLYDLSQKSGKPAVPGGPSNADPLAVPPGPNKPGYDSDFTDAGLRTDYWNWGIGFISAYPPDQFIMLEHGATYGGRNNQIWAPYYTLHKILAGLLDCYEVGGNKKALEIAEGMGTWVYKRLNALPAKTRISMWNRYIAGEYGGMNEVMARMYRLTKNKQFLDCAQLFDNISFFYGDTEHTGGLIRNVDTIRTKHANQHIPQMTGAIETYKGTQNAEYWEIADNFWDKVTNSYMYAIGGVGGAMRNAECFTSQPDSLWFDGFNRSGQNETCATYNMLKLTRQLFMYEQDGKFMDYYEQALYNDILASVAENNAGNTYHIPLNPGARKSFGNANMTGFTCCNGTALESSTKLQDSIYFRSSNDKALYVNLYVPSTLTWAQRNVVVTQNTNYPYSDTTKLTIKGQGDFDIKVRVPRWATKGFFVKINGKDLQVKAEPGTYISIGSNFKDGDIIELRMPFHFYLSPVMDQPNMAAIFYGPVLLAAEESAGLQDYRPLTLDASDIGKSIKGDPSTLRFNIGDVSLKPFYETYTRYSVYFDVTLR